MPLTGPVLDDRSFDDLRRELLDRIRVYAPEWTDHNESDPGIALLELFAFLGESLLYRFNQIPESTKVEFLKLLGVRPNAATVAEVLVAADTTLAAGVQMLAGTRLRAGSVEFETANEVYVWPVAALGAGKTVTARGTDAAGGGDEAEQDRELLLEALRRAGLATDDATVEASTVYTTTVLSDRQAAAEPLDVAATADRALWVALTGTPRVDIGARAGGSVFIGVAVDEDIAAVRARRDAEQADVNAHAAEEGLTLSPGEDFYADPPGMTWRLWRGPAPAGTPAATAATAGTGADWIDLPVLHDTTRGLTTTGVVQLQLPAALAKAPAADGVGERPPPLDDPKQAAAVLAWLRATRPDGDTHPMPRVSWVGVNAADARQAVTVTVPELLGTGTGDADQSYALTGRQILPFTTVLEVEEVGGWQQWREVDDLGGSGPFDRDFEVDYAAGTVLFGRDGRYGRRPGIGERIRARSYRRGGGAAGNVPAGAVTSSTVAGVKIRNPVPAEGGGDAESVSAAVERIPATVHRRDRAVTAADFRDLALEVAGVGRAEPLPLLRPAPAGKPDPYGPYTQASPPPERDAAGCLTVVVLPERDRRDPDRPMPDRSLLRRVALHLDARRLVTTEVHVVGPVYVPVALSVGVDVQPGYQVDAVRRWVELILRQYLAPLPPYGPDGRGWPLGRPVRRAELAAVAVQVEGVASLADLKLAAGSAERERIDLTGFELPAVDTITVVVGTPPTPGDGPPAPAPGSGYLVPYPTGMCQ